MMKLCRPVEVSPPVCQCRIQLDRPRFVGLGFALLAKTGRHTPMKKSDLVDAIAGKAGTPKAQVQQMVDDVFELIAEGLSKGEKIDLRGFGTFSVRDSA